jgi:hypothetical protein
LQAVILEFTALFRQLWKVIIQIGKGSDKFGVLLNATAKLLGGLLQFSCI